MACAPDTAHLARCVTTAPLLQERAFRFLAPTTVTLIGAAAQGTLLADAPVADVAIELPSACLLEKDYLNGRWALSSGFRGSPALASLWTAGEQAPHRAIVQAARQAMSVSHHAWRCRVPGASGRCVSLCVAAQRGPARRFWHAGTWVAGRLTCTRWPGCCAASAPAVSNASPGPCGRETSGARRVWQWWPQQQRLLQRGVTCTSCCAST